MEDKDMGVLWENMEKVDIQAERRNTADAKRTLEATEKLIAALEKIIHSMADEPKELELG